MSPLPDRTPWLRQDPAWTLQHWEDAMRAALETPPFANLHFTLPMRTYQLMHEVMRLQQPGTVQEVGVAGSVTRRIFVRLMQDLRAVQQLAAIGSASAAGTVASSLAEVAYEVAWVGRDDERAQRWLDHTVPKNAVEAWGTRWNEVSALRHADPALARAAVEYEAQVYRQLCMLKHGNSMLQKGLGSVVADGAEYISPLPMLTHNTLGAAGFAVFHAVRLCLEASADYVRISDVAPDQRQTLLTRQNALLEQLVSTYMQASEQMEFLSLLEWNSEQGAAARLALTSVRNVFDAGRWGGAT